MITSTEDRAQHLNALLGRPYVARGMGPDAFDCYGLARHLQHVFFGRHLPLFSLPADAGRFAIASAIAVHPERGRWDKVDKPADGHMAIMARQDCGFHMGVYLDLDGGVIAHTLEQTGVVVDQPFRLSGPAQRWRISYFELSAE